MSEVTLLNCRPLAPLRRKDSLEHCVYRSSAYALACVRTGKDTARVDGGQPISTGIRWYVNLRGPSESVEGLSLKWFDQFQRVDLAIETRLPDQVRCNPSAADYATWYESMLDLSAAYFARAFCVVASVAHEGVVFACQHGKDRTGLLAAAILEATGASRELILEDYAKSGADLAAHGEVFASSWEKRGMKQEEYVRRFHFGDAPLRHLYFRLGWEKATPILDAIGAAVGTDLDFVEAVSRMRALSLHVRK